MNWRSLWRGRSLGGLVLLALTAWLVPGPLYVLALAVFGLPHVLWELALIRSTAANVWPRWGWWSLAAVLVLQIGGRVGSAARLVDPTLTGQLDLLSLSLAVGLCCVLPGPDASRMRWGLRLLAATVTLALGICAHESNWTFTIGVLMVLSVAHNFTPLGLRYFARRSCEPQDGSPGRELIDRSAPVDRIWWMFAMVPVLLLLPSPQEIVAPLNGWLSGGLHPPPEVGWLNSRLPFWCTGLAGALVLAQCLHYWAVLVKLPAQVKIWPTPRWRWAALALSGLMSVGFIWDFSAARGWYAVAAGAHAWLEWPLLLYGLLVLRPTERPTLFGAPSIPLA